VTHVLSYFDSDYLHSYDLPTPEYVVEIERVEAGELTAQGGRKQKKPVVYFRAHKKGLALNKTNARVLIALYGTEIEAWAGKRVTLFTTTTEMAGEVVACIRIRPTPPKAELKAAK